MTSPAPTLCGLSATQIEALMKDWGQPAYRAKQIYQQVYVNLAESPAAMSNLPGALRERLARDVPLGSLELTRVRTSDKGLTRKALFQLPSNAPVEAVLMIYNNRATVCVSTQSGCAMKCAFCATGQLGFTQNLTAGQMVEQVLWAAREIRHAGVEVKSLSNIVYMGMGEPFNNYDHWWASVERLHDPDGLNMGARSFTVSTVGVVPGIRRLAQEKMEVNLAVSLHAANDELRTRLTPSNKKYPIPAILEAVRDYIRATNRRVSFEYVLLQGVNDGPTEARSLAELLRGILCHVNLIPWNPVPGTPLDPSERRRVLSFQEVLHKQHVPCTVRVQRGVDIAASCGQLAGGLKGRDQ
jgi:23S rRNA (adenine2503-C2)-methyltransferase